LTNFGGEFEDLSSKKRKEKKDLTEVYKKRIRKNL
jgi:hypothetical protein